MGAAAGLPEMGDFATKKRLKHRPKTDLGRDFSLRPAEAAGELGMQFLPYV